VNVEVGTDGAAQTFCSRQTGAAFCDDFDAPDASLTPKWDLATIPSGELRIDGVSPKSPPGALLTIVPSPGMAGDNALFKFFPPHATTRVAFDLILEEKDLGGYGSLVEIHVKPPPAPYTDYRVALIYTSGRMTLDVYAEGGGAATFVDVPTTFAAWTRAELALVLTPSPRGVLYSDTGVELASVPMPVIPSPASTRLSVGVPYLARATAPWRAQIDNVVVTFGD
jgi:hypothetical protein